MLSKKHYIEIAKIIATTTTREELINKLVSFFKNDNFKFDIDKFESYILKIQQAK